MADQRVSDAFELGAETEFILQKRRFTRAGLEDADASRLNDNLLCDRNALELRVELWGTHKN